MKILERNVYVGPNLYAHFRVIRLSLDLGPLEDWPTSRLGKDFTEALLAALPGLQAHTCSYDAPGGFVRRMTEGDGTWLGHVIEHVAIELQNAAGELVSFGKTRSAGRPGLYDVVYEYEEEDVGVEAGQLALKLIASLLPAELHPAGAVPDGFVWDEARDAFIRFAQKRAFGPSTASLIRAAEERDIPWLRLNEYSLVQLGHACHSKRIQATITSETRHIAVEIASDKEETNRILGDLGLPVPRQTRVSSEDECLRAARKIGYPVVIKPLDANHGRGVSINLSDDEHVKQAFEKAKLFSRSVLVEKYVVGLDHRMLVVDGKLIAVSKRVPGHVVGDGVHTIEQLVEIVNADPRRGIGHEKVLTRLEFDFQANRLMELAGHTRATVLPRGEVFYLRSTGNLSTGGTAVDLTDAVHPDNREMAERAARAIGLDVCGVDFLTADVTQPYKEVGGAICEVNAAPGFRMHVAPSEGKPRDVAAPVMDMLFPPGAPSRIPIATITGTNGKTTTARMVAHVFKMTGKRVGLTTTDGVYIDGHLSVPGDMTGPASARMVLRDPKVEVAVLEAARGGLLRSGLGYRWTDVGCVTNIQSDHLGLRGIHTLEQLARVKRIVAEVARDTAVLNGDDPNCLRMADHTQAKHVCYVTMNARNGLVRDHIRAGGRAAVLEQGMGGLMITIYDAGQHIPLMWAHRIPATLDGRALHNVQNAMFAAAIAYSMHVSLEEIRHGLSTFDTTFFQAPGRMNVFHDHPFKVILDYGHNAAAIKAMVELVERLKPAGRRIVVVAAPGDRRDEDVREIARLCAGHFDHYVCRRDDNPRGRKDDEIPRMLADTLIAQGVDPRRIEVLPHEPDAVHFALNAARPDDLVLVFGDQLSRTWKQIQDFTPGEGARRVATAAAPSEVDLGSFADLGLDGGVELIRDERGVRIAAGSSADEVAD
jgi:cyanophycin synthetase